MGRPRDKVWQRVTQLKGGRWKCNDCGGEFAGGASRIKVHLNITSDKVIKDQGIGLCTGKANSNNDTEHNPLHSRGQIQGDAKYQGRIQVGSSSFVSNWENEDLQMIECLRPEELVFRSPRLYLTKSQFITLKPGTWLDSGVIDMFVEILTESEKKKATPSNCYLTVMFSKAALESVEHNFKDFVQRQNIRENYLFHIKSPEKVFIPVHIEQEKQGHFYLYIFHLNKKVVEIWDSLPTFVAETERDETTKKLLFAMEKLFEKVTFTKFHLKKADDILLQPPNNGFDCGIFVINYMQQSDNYVKGDSSFQFESQKEREDLALKLLNNDLNKEKQNLYDKARRHYAQLERQDGNDASRMCFEDVGKELKDWSLMMDGLQQNCPMNSGAGEIQSDAKYGSSSVSNRVNIEEHSECGDSNGRVSRHEGMSSMMDGLQQYCRMNKEAGEIQADAKFDSDKERTHLALKLINSGLNQEKDNLYDEARGHHHQEKNSPKRQCAQVEKQDDSKRFRADISKEHSEDVGRAQESECGDFDGRVSRHEGSSRSCILPTTYLIGEEFQRYTEQIWKWIKDDRVSAIGVWGTGGSGKTALASHIYEKLLEEGDTKVIWVTVSQKCRISHLQKVIARSIELNISDELEVKIIAEKLFQAFKDMQKCVIILDDVWDQFSLKEVGVPVQDNQITLILTTRIWEVCQGMDCENNAIIAESLYEEDGWALFKKIIGFHDDLSLEVQKIAKKIAYACEGLPLAIVEIAKRMKGKKHVGEWSHMLECLINLGNGQFEIEKWVLPILRSSYDFLSKKLQRFFLHCALSTNGCFYVEDADHLIRRFVYESIDETKKLRVLYNEGYNMLDKLKDHCMLEQVDDDDDFECHIYKFLSVLAIGIAENTGKIMANAYKNLTEIPSDAQWRDGLTKAFLMGNKIKGIPDGTCLVCSQLSTLLLNGNADLKYIPYDFFNNMPVLETLDLSGTCIECLPESVSSLKCLTALLLSRCRELRYIPSLSKLKRLISLDLSMTIITEAPMGLDSLGNLRCLNLLHTHMLMSSSLISKLINLEHLLGPKVTETDIQGLDDLEVIVAFFQDISVFNTYVNFLDKNCKLWSFHLILEDANEIYDADLGAYGEYYSNSIKRITFGGMDLGNIKAVLPGDIKELVIDHCQRVGTVGSCLCNVLSYGHNNNNPHQIELQITDCEGVEYLCCVSGSCPFCSSFQLVGHLSLYGLKDLKDIVSPYALRSLHQHDLFSYLSDLRIRKCHSMETLMTPTFLALLQNLRTIDVDRCEMMKEIVGEDHSQTDSGDLMALVPNRLSDPTPITLPKLTSLILLSMPQLNFVYRGIMLCPSLKTFSAEYCGQLNLPRIEISNGCQLPIEKTFRGGYRWPIKTD